MMTRWMLKGFAGGMNALPPGAARALGRSLGWVYGSVARYHRRDAREALQRSLPETSPAERRRILGRMYRNLGLNLVELCRLPSTSDAYLQQHIVWDGEANALDAFAMQKGALVLSAHMGNWDLLCTLGPRFGHPVTVITKEIKNKAINDYWMDIRSRFGLKFVPRHNSYRTCLTALRRHEVIAFVLDQNMIDTEGIFVDFFGRPACTTPGLAYLSAQSGAPVLPVFLLREGDDRHRLMILPMIEPPPDRKPETIRAYTQRYTRTIEDMVRKHPDQWIWIHRRWRTVPKPSPAAGSPPAESDPA